MDDRQNSLAMLPLLLAFFGAGALGTFAAAALPELRQHFAITASQGSLLYVAWGIGIVVGSLAAAHTISVLSPAIILACSAILGVAATHIGMNAQSYAVFLVSYGILGTISGAIITTGHGYVGRSSNARSASNISALDFSLSVGTVCAPMLVTYFGADTAAVSGWRDTLIFMEVGLLIFAGLVIFLDFGAPLPVAQSSADAQDGLQRIRRRSFLEKANPILMWFAVVSFFHHAFEYGHTYWFITYAADLPGIGVEKARITLVGFLLGITVSRMVLSWFAARDVMKQVLSVAVGISLAIVIFMPGYSEYAELYLANVAFGLAVGAIFPALLAVVVSTSDNRGAVFSSTGLISGAFGTQFAAVVLGFVIEMGAAQEVYTILAVIGAALFICANLLIRSSINIGADNAAREKAS